MPRISVEVEEQNLEHASIDGSGFYFEYEVFVENCGAQRRKITFLRKSSRVMNVISSEPGLRVLLWILVCHMFVFVLSGSRRTFAYGSAEPLKSRG